MRSGDIPCPCGRWAWREVVVSTGLAAVERTCPKCKNRRLLILKRGQLVAHPVLTGRDARSIEQVLAESDLTLAEISDMMRVVRILGR